MPCPSGMDDDDFKNYLTRAQFFNATGRTLDGFCGMLTRKPLYTEVPKGLEQYLENIDGKGHELNSFVKDIIYDSLQTSWGGLLVDMPAVTSQKSVKDYENEKISPYITFYKAEDIINWSWYIEGRQSKLEYVIFKEPKFTEIDRYSKKLETVYRVCEIDKQSGIYIQRLYDSELNLMSESIPRNNGIPFREIPFTFLFSGTEPKKPIIADLVNTNLSHYWKMADLNNGGHWTGVPTPYVVGAEPKTDEKGEPIPMRLGGTEVKYLPLGGSMHYLEFVGSGCSLLRAMITDDEERMAMLGTRVIYSEKRGVEAAETAKIHSAGANSILASFAYELSSALKNIVRIYLEWCTGKEIELNDIDIKVNTDFDVANMTPAELTALVSAWQSGGISKKVLFKNFKEGELIDSATTFEEMELDIENEQISKNNGGAENE